MHPIVVLMLIGVVALFLAGLALHFWAGEDRPGNLARLYVRGQRLCEFVDEPEHDDSVCLDCRICQSKAFALFLDFLPHLRDLVADEVSGDLNLTTVRRSILTDIEKRVNAAHLGEDDRILLYDLVEAARGELLDVGDEKRRVSVSAAEEKERKKLTS